MAHLIGLCAFLDMTAEPPDIETNQCDRRPNYVTGHQQTHYIHIPELTRLKVGGQLTAAGQPARGADLISPVTLGGWQAALSNCMLG